MFFFGDAVRKVGRTGNEARKEGRKEKRRKKQDGRKQTRASIFIHTPFIFLKTYLYSWGYRLAKGNKEGQLIKYHPVSSVFINFHKFNHD